MRSIAEGLAAIGNTRPAAEGFCRRLAGGDTTYGEKNCFGDDQSSSHLYSTLRFSP